MGVGGGEMKMEEVNESEEGKNSVEEGERSGVALGRRVRGLGLAVSI